jgi:hypothetical protein
MVLGVVQPDLPAPGGEPLRAADNNVEGLLPGLSGGPINVHAIAVFSRRAALMPTVLDLC